MGTTNMPTDSPVTNAPTTKMPTGSPVTAVPTTGAPTQHACESGSHTCTSEGAKCVQNETGNWECQCNVNGFVCVANCGAQTPPTCEATADPTTSPVTVAPVTSAPTTKTPTESPVTSAPTTKTP